MIHISPVVGVPGETGLLSAGVSGQCMPPHCGLQVAAGGAAPSRRAPFHSLVASALDLRQARNVPGSAIESPRCLLSVKVWSEFNFVGLLSLKNKAEKKRKKQHESPATKLTLARFKVAQLLWGYCGMSTL